MSLIIQIVFFSAITFSTSLCFALDLTETLNQNFTYDSDDGSGNWVQWSNSNATYTSGWTSAEDASNNAGGSFYVDATLTSPAGTSLSLLYLQLPADHPLYGVIDLNASVKVEMLSAVNTNPTINLGYGVNYQPYMTSGSTQTVHSVDIENTNWQALSGDAIPRIEGHREARVRGFYPLATAEDVLPTTNGAVLFILNRSADSSMPSTLQVRVYIDDVDISGSVPNLTAYNVEAQARKDAYVANINSEISLLDTAIANALTTIANIDAPAKADAISHIGAQTQLFDGEYQAIKVDYNSGGSEINRRINVPTPDQFDTMIALAGTIASRSGVAQYIEANESSDLLHYPTAPINEHGYLDHELEIKTAASPLVTDPVNATMALGEFEPLSVFLQNPTSETITINSVTANDWTNQFNQVLPAQNIDMRIVKQWYIPLFTETNGVPDSYIGPELLLYDDSLITVDRQNEVNFIRATVNSSEQLVDIKTPTALMPHGSEVYDATDLQPFSIESFHSRQLWITVDTHAEVRPGNYQGNLMINYTIGSSSETKNTSIPVAINVLPVQLQASNLDYLIYYAGFISPEIAGLGAIHKSEIQYRAEMANMKHHGIDYPIQYLWGTPTDYPANLAPHFSIREEEGLPCEKIFLAVGKGNVNKNGSTAIVENKVSEITSALDAIVSCSNPEVYFYGQDEARGEAQTEQIPNWQAAQSVGGKIYIAGHIGSFDNINTVDGVEDGVIDTIVLAGEPNHTDNLPEIAKWRGAGKDVYSYSNPQAQIANATIYREQYGLFLWQYDYTGFANFAYQYPFPSTFSGRVPDTQATVVSHDRSEGKCFSYQEEGYCTIWNDFNSHPFRDHLYTYPTSDGVVDTIFWEGLREGKDDTRYLATLQMLNTQQSNVVLQSEIDNWISDLKSTSYPDLDSTRTTMQNYISTLSQAANSAPTISNILVAIVNDGVIVSGQANDADHNLAVITLTIGDQMHIVNLFQNDGSWEHTFTDLSPGEYELNVSATDYWDESSAPSLVSVTVLNEFQIPVNSLWALAMLALMVLTLRNLKQRQS